jgi:sulfopyruvate decarboxylase TPP-binding subunit
MNVEAKAESKMLGWQDQIYELLRQNQVTQFAYVPDAGHRVLIDRSLADPEVFSVALTTEEEGVALLAGADLGGEPPKFKRDLDPARCRVRFRTALRPPA